MAFINKQSQAIAARLMTVNCNTGMLLPFVDKKSGEAFYVVNEDGKKKFIPMSSVPQQFQQNAVLPIDCYKALEATFTKVKRERLVMHSDAMALGSVGLGDQSNALGTFEYKYPKLDDPGAYKIGMELHTNTTNKTHDIDYAGIPLPIIWDEFSITGRQINAMQRGQYGLGGLTLELDMALVEGSARRVAEGLEELMIDGSDAFTFGGNTIYGYTNFPGRNTVDISLEWDNASKTGAQILADVLSMIQQLETDRYYGPYTLYIPANYSTVMENDFKAESDKTIRQRLLEIPQITAIKVVDRLPDDNVILVQLASDVVQIVNGFAPSVIQWNSPDGLTFNYYVMAMQIPLFRSTYSSQCGFCHGYNITP